jgi:predicted transcriptional regulator of viral defense system
MTRREINVLRLLEYTQRFQSGVLTRRVGYLLELYKIASPELLAPLRTALSSTYDRLDPTLPKVGHYQAHWRLQLNIESEELEAIRHT